MREGVTFGLPSSSFRLLDLPDIVERRREFFADSDRRTQIGASVLDPDWIATVRRSPPPYLLVAETVFVYLEEAQVKAAPRLALPLRASLWFFGRFFPKLMNLHRLNLFVGR
jgi:hypothetical protein